MKLKTILLSTVAILSLNIGAMTTVNAAGNDRTCNTLQTEYDNANAAWFNAMIAGDFVRAAALSQKVSRAFSKLQLEGCQVL